MMIREKEFAKSFLFFEEFIQSAPTMEPKRDSDSIFRNKEILLLEDDDFLANRLVSKFESMGGEVTKCKELSEAREALQNLFFDFALLDLNLPDGESLDLLRKQNIPSSTLTILMTAQGGIESAVEAMRIGAADFVSKPFELEEIELIFIKANQLRKNQRLILHDTEKRKLQTNNLFFRGCYEEDLRQLTKITEVDNRLRTYLPPLLIDGPTGSGKSTYARWIHDNGPRHEASFVSLNCSAIPQNLIESELFGHEKGSFTDAKTDRIGLFEAADKGTLFLDEVSSLSLEAQSKLLVSIENGFIRRIGSSHEIRVDVRIIAAANQNLRELIQAGDFREDLFHRLDLLRIQIPPLSSRGRDIIDLAHHLLGNLAGKYKLKIPKIDPSSAKELINYKWPGNVRELIHEIERALIYLEPGKNLTFNLKRNETNLLSSQDWLNPNFEFPQSGFDLESEMLRLMDMAIKQSNGNVTEAAKLLGVSRDYIRYRKKKQD